MDSSHDGQNPRPWRVAALLVTDTVVTATVSALAVFVMLWLLRPSGNFIKAVGDFLAMDWFNFGRAETASIGFSSRSASTVLFLRLCGSGYT